MRMGRRLGVVFCGLEDWMDSMVVDERSESVLLNWAFLGWAANSTVRVGKMLNCLVT